MDINAIDRSLSVWVDFLLGWFLDQREKGEDDLSNKLLQTIVFAVEKSKALGENAINYGGELVNTMLEDVYAQSQANFKPKKVFTLYLYDIQALLIHSAFNEILNSLGSDFVKVNDFKRIISNYFTYSKQVFAISGSSRWIVECTLFKYPNLSLQNNEDTQ